MVAGVHRLDQPKPARGLGSAVAQSLLAWSLVGVAQCVVGCHAPAPEHPVAVAEAQVEPRAAGDVEVEPTPNASGTSAVEAGPQALTDRWEKLEIPPFAPSLVSLPNQEAPQFWLMAVHGAGDAASYQCEFWREVLGPEHGIVVCPVGKPIHEHQDRGYFFADHLELEKEVAAASARFLADYADRLASQSGVYSAYSQGATMGSLMLLEHAETFPRLLLIEGGFSQWNVARGQAFRDKGGRQIAFVCGTQHCFNHAQRAVMWLQKAGVAARLWYEPRAGHTYAGLLTPQVQRAFEWLLTGE